ncbi:MAG: hypothetical protein IM613_13655 [Cytophagales bacterium]|nr:hypothetical protein [Cytophagales bacterium]
MTKRIAVETLTLREISELFRQSFEIAFPKSKGSIDKTMKRIRRANITAYKWIKTYEEFKGAKISFYCEKVPYLDSPLVSVAMTHRTTEGLILIALDTSNGGIISTNSLVNKDWDKEKWVKIYTAHCCERFAERIMKVENPTFQIGSRGIMFADTLGPVRVTGIIAEGIDEIEFQFKEGQAYGYRDTKNKFTYFKTVYSNDMLRASRLDFHNEWKVPLNQLYELFKRD